MKSGRRLTPGITLFGLGNWGTSLAHGLRSEGIPIGEIVIESTPSRRARARDRFYCITPLERARLDAEILWLCVPDDAIQESAHRLVERAQVLGKNRSPLLGQIVVHSSGVFSSEILKEAERSGASVGSVHPLMTFPARTPVSLRDVPFGVEGSPAARRKLNAIVRRLGGCPFPLDSSQKALYHAMAMMASPLLASLIAAMQETGGLAGLSPAQVRQLIEPISRATIENVLSRGLGSSLSGPLTRGDATTIHLHLQALAPHPMLAKVYQSLALHALEAFPVCNREELHRLLRRPPSMRKVAKSA